MKRWMLTILFILCCSYALHAQPWVVTFSNSRPPIPVANTAELNAAIAAAQPGHTIELADGGNFSGLFTISRSGSAAEPILITVPAGGHAIVTGAFKITGAYVYVIGLEITGGTANFNEGIALSCSYCAAINNVIHGIKDAVGIGAWNNGPGQIIYGNIIFENTSGTKNPHAFYSQNNYATNGWKYVVANVLIDAANVTSNTYNLHIYAEGNFVSGFFLKYNILVNGRSLTGGWNVPHNKIDVFENYFYKSDMGFGYKRPIEFRFEDNYLGRCGLKSGYFWGEGEGTYQALQFDPITILRNRIIFPLSTHLYIQTSRYTAAGVQELGVAKFRPGDQSNNNHFGGPFKASLSVGGSFYAGVTRLIDWHKYTRDKGGIEFDTNSTEALTETNKQFYIQNEYDSNRGHLAVYNWENLPSVQFSKPGSFAVHKIKDPFGPPIVTGSGSVPIPLSGEFETFLIKASPDPPPPACPDTIEELRKIRKDLADRTLQCQPKVKRCKQEIDALILLLEECE